MKPSNIREIDLLSDTYSILKDFGEFMEKANSKLFIFIFGEIGNNLYHEHYYAICNKNMLTFFNSLDDMNKEKLICNILFCNNLYDNC